jgi:hypothetical protein
MRDPAAGEQVGYLTILSGDFWWSDESQCPVLAACRCWRLYTFDDAVPICPLQVQAQLD